MKPEKVFEEKEYLVIAAIKQRFGSITRARQIAERNNMEVDDLIQVVRMHLWQCCVKCDAERIDTFHAYVMKGMKWAMSDELHMKGIPFKVSRKVSHEERNQINIHSIDWHRDEESVNEFYEVSPIDVEEEALLSVGFEEVTSALEGKGKLIIMHVGEGYTEREIAVKLGMGKSTVNPKKNEAFFKINPDYKPLNVRTFFLGIRRKMRNRQLGLTV
ncbi:sigma-70 RNA polymerase sigma factor region 4 domain-containing protein [Bacillus cereus]|uniref:sigma-70 family RNA polymerase sigma factor n=1 Tax=Bacillus cereus TaxID=1396 RepID=UPI00397EF17A